MFLNTIDNPNDGLPPYEANLVLTDKIKADNCLVFVPDRWDSNTNVLTVYVTFHKLTII